jgi:hypothetical protein
LIDPLTAAAGSDFAHFDPSVLVAAVNALLTLGKDEALATVERHLVATDRATDPAHGTFLVLRLLFDLPDSGDQPPIRIGVPGVLEPRDTAALPYFPLLVVDDVPLLLVTTFLLGGAAEPVEAHLAYFRAYGVLRSAPLQPRTDLGAPAVLAHADALYRKAYGQGLPPGVRAVLEAQLERWVAASRQG